MAPCFSPKDPDALPLLKIIQSFGFNRTECYDDYNCDTVGWSAVNRYALGYTCLIICVCGVIGNLVLLPAYSMGMNRSGLTVYLSAIACFDIVYLILAVMLLVVRYIQPTFADQLITYSQFSAYLVPYGSPLMQLCELVVVSVCVCVCGRAWAWTV